MIYSLDNLVCTSLSCNETLQVYNNKAGQLTHQGPLLPNMVVSWQEPRKFPHQVRPCPFPFQLPPTRCNRMCLSTKGKYPIITNQFQSTRLCSIGQLKHSFTNTIKTKYLTSYCTNKNQRNNASNKIPSKPNQQK